MSVTIDPVAAWHIDVLMFQGGKRRHIGFKRVFPIGSSQWGAAYIKRVFYTTMQLTTKPSAQAIPRVRFSRK